MTISDFEGKTALVTGSTSGIGEATARILGARGAHVLVVGRDKTRGDALVSTIRASGGKADFIAATLGDGDSARALARHARELGGGHVDILINNVGMGPLGPTAQMHDSDFDATFNLNVKVPFVLVGELAPEMAQRGHGAIVNVGTMAAQIGIAGMALYGSSKAALNLLTKAWAVEFGPNGVRVNGVNPGPVRTPMTEPMGEALDQLASLAPAGRVASPTELAEAITYLASDAASFIHGAILDVDGGRLAS